MLSSMQMDDIVSCKRQGMSNRATAAHLGISRGTVDTRVKEYNAAQEQLKTETDPAEIQRLTLIVTGEKPYNTAGRRTVCTPEVYQAVQNILELEAEKDRALGHNKQHLTIMQMWEMLQEQGFKIGYTSTKTVINELRNSHPECFIAQEHPMGKRLEYDFGEVKLIVAGKREKYYMAVLAAPASNFRWVFLYKKANMEVFLDSHVKFFSMIGGVWKEIVYDNMKNVVDCIKRSEKVINEEARKIALYYDFAINTTNVRRGNEKGYVESSVKYTRRQFFTKRYRFASEDELYHYLSDSLEEYNKDSKIEEEKTFLRPANVEYNIAVPHSCKVNHLSLIRVDKHDYSVPDDLVAKEVTAYSYIDRIDVYRKHEFICSHRKSTSPGKTIDIRHYLRTLRQKPGALADSVALASNPDLKLLYDVHYTKNPKKFIEFMWCCKDLNDEEMVREMNRLTKKEKQKGGLVPNHELEERAYYMTSLYNNLTVGKEQDEYCNQ